jgi:hypothetical protein
MTAQEIPPQQWDSAVVPQAPGPARRRNWRPYIGLGICIAVAVGGIIILVTVVAPWASAAGGCGGG